AKTDYGATPIFFACDRGNTEIVKLLLAHGADVTVSDTFYKSTPIVWAVMRDRAEVVKLLIEKQPQSKETAMGMAVGMGRVATAKVLLEAGGFKPEALSTYLTTAEKSKQPEIAELLKKAGAQPKPRVEYKVEPEALKRYEGVYKSEQLEITITIKEGQLTCTLPGTIATLIPTAQHQFEIESQPQVSLAFKLEEERTVSLSLKGPGGETVLKRVEVK
ncbi:MAG TPA: ankyrin repeat domain-containing protein, partial [Blastocatellia bacterium]|nr:ankyrin repeat domain-containing protein [Blastocatellia bacterium]